MGVFASAAIYGSLAFTLYSLSAAHTNDFADPEELIQVARALLVAYGIGAIFGPILSAFMMGRIGPNGLFGSSAVITAVLGFYAIYRVKVRDTKSFEDKAPFIPVPSTQYTSEEIYGAALDEREQEKQKADIATTTEPETSAD